MYLKVASFINKSKKRKIHGSNYDTIVNCFFLSSFDFLAILSQAKKKNVNYIVTTTVNENVVLFFSSLIQSDQEWA